MDQHYDYQAAGEQVMIGVTGSPTDNMYATGSSLEEITQARVQRKAESQLSVLTEV
jgi:predicted secreted protein